MKKSIGFVFVLALFGCSDYEEVAPGIGMKKLKEGTGTGMQDSSDFFYMDLEIRDEQDRALESPQFSPKFSYITQMRPPVYATDFMRVVPSLKSGDSVSLRLMADSIFVVYYNMQPPSIVMGRTVHLHLKLQEVLSEEAYYARMEKMQDDQKIKAISEFDAYLRQNNITEQPVGTGTLKVTTVPGTGPQAFYGDVVSIHMVQRLFDGTEVENSYKAGKPFEYEIGGDYGLKGMDEALVKMKKGEKAMIYLPYFLAFGEVGYEPKVPPYSNLIIEMELLEVRKPISQ